LSEPQRVLVPRKAIHELARLLEEEETVSFQQVENHLVFVVGGRTLASKMIEGQFPAFEQVIAVRGDKVVHVRRCARRGASRRPLRRDADAAVERADAEESYPCERPAREAERFLCRMAADSFRRRPPVEGARGAKRAASGLSVWVARMDVRDVRNVREASL